MATKPSSKIDWTESNPSVRVEPTSGKKNTGWNIDERPPREYFNWLFFNIDEWIDYLEEVTDGIAGAIEIYAAYIGTVSPGSLASHASINAAMADVDVTTGSRILVLESATLTTIQVISKPDIQVDFKPNVTYTKGSVATGIRISQDGCVINWGRFAGFSAGGDKAILIDAGADYALLLGQRYSGNTLDVSDLSGTASLIAQRPE